MESLFIGGQWVAGEGVEFATVNPASGKLAWQGRAASRDDVNRAVIAARAAQPGWAALLPVERMVYLQRFAAGLANHKSALAQQIG
ncbi:MAG: aldehyde dehydrogenase family protein, partial [Betaproteobacteria bacterium]|nr:aldehyde dehydrogenase family protein [Betaproteobacteria bacterium]